MNKYLAHDLMQVGVKMRQIRTLRKLTLDAVAQRTGLSKGLLSKIENFRTIPSLPVLAAIARSLRIELAELVSGIGRPTASPYVVIRKKDRMFVKRDNAIGFLYQSLMTRNVGDRVFEAFVLTLRPRARRKFVTTDGHQFVFILKGTIVFHIGSERLHLQNGDALFFDGRIPHVPINTSQKDARLLAIYLL